MSNAFLSTAELRRLFRQASTHKATDTLSRYKLTEAAAETLIRVQAREAFAPSQFYVSRADYEKHIDSAGRGDGIGGLSTGAEGALALWCMKRAALAEATDAVLVGTLIGHHPVVLDEVLCAMLTRGTLPLHRAAYVLVGALQERLRLIPKETWGWAKVELIAAGMPNGKEE